MRKSQHLSLREALEQDRMKEFIAQYKDVKGDSEMVARAPKRAAGARQQAPRKVARTPR